MKASVTLFLIGFRQVIKDGILLILLPAPFLLGAILKMGLPIADCMVMTKFQFSLQPWYPLSDALVLTMTPMLMAMISSFLILDERDEGIGAYYAITPASGQAYLIARIVFPMLWAFVFSIIVHQLFALSHYSFYAIISVALIGTLQGVVTCMFLVALASNKVEGLALSKLVGIFALGFPVAWVINSPHKYFFGFLPSFWLGEIAYGAESLAPSTLNVLSGILCATIWILALRKIFLQRARL